MVIFYKIGNLSISRSSLVILPLFLSSHFSFYHLSRSFEMPAILDEFIPVFGDTGEVFTYAFQRGTPRCLEIRLRGRRKRSEISVGIRAEGDVCLTFRDSPMDVLPNRAFTVDILWVNMTPLEGHDWGRWLARKYQRGRRVRGGYHAVVLCCSDLVMAHDEVEHHVRMLGFEPSVSIRGMRTCPGSFVVGTTEYLSVDVGSVGDVVIPDPPFDFKLSLHITNA